GGSAQPVEVLRLLQELLRLHLGELREAAPARLVSPDLLLAAGHRVQAIALGALAAALVAVDDHLVAHLPALHLVADLPDDARGAHLFGHLAQVLRHAPERKDVGHLCETSSWASTSSSRVPPKALG